MKHASFRTRVGNAWAGIRIVWRREKTFRTQGLFALAAFAACAWLRAGPLWWALVSLGIFMVVALEAMNAALEYALDRLHPERHAEIGHAKDAAAGAVLLASLGTAGVGALLLLDRWRG
ncbi:MAG TPA: diacylglycerol kinase [Allosphingosinicella sp.]|nr:diacylglycerol kinase [Allosphingosinicella sp.]